jgi:hypothetical protein
MTTTEADGAYAFDELLWGTYAVREMLPPDGGGGEDSFADSILDDLFGDISLLPEMPGAYYDFGGLAPLFWGETFIGDGGGGFPPGSAEDLWYAVSQGERDVPSAAYFADLLEGTCQVASAGLPADTDYPGPLGGSVLVEMLGTDLPAGTPGLDYDFAAEQPQTPVALAPSTDALVPSNGLVDPPPESGPGPNLAEAGAAPFLGTLEGFARLSPPEDGAGLDDGLAAVRPACLGGVIWVADKEFEADPGTFSVAGKAGVTVELTGTDDRDRAVSLTTTSDSEGRYCFKGLYPGEYAVRVATPRGFRTVEARPGTKGGYAEAKRRIDEVRLNAGDDGSEYEFYYEGTGRVSGRVTCRAEPARRTVGMAGVTLFLTGIGRDGQPVGRTTTTDAKGKYLFHALPPGTYRVEVNSEPGRGPWAKSPAQVNGRPAGVPADDAVAVEGIPLGADGRATDLDFTANGGAE